MNAVKDLKFLPPTENALELNLKRAHYQRSIWKNVKSINPTNLSPEEYGWMKDTANKCLEAIPFEAETSIAPDFFINMTF